MRFLNNNVRSAIHIGLKEVLDNIYSLLCHWNWHKPSRAASYMIKARCDHQDQRMYHMLKNEASRNTLPYRQ